MAQNVPSLATGSPSKPPLGWMDTSASISKHFRSLWHKICSKQISPCSSPGMSHVSKEPGFFLVGRAFLTPCPHPQALKPSLGDDLSVVLRKKGDTGFKKRKGGGFGKLVLSRTGLLPCERIHHQSFAGQCTPSGDVVTSFFSQELTWP